MLFACCCYSLPTPGVSNLDVSARFGTLLFYILPYNITCLLLDVYRTMDWFYLHFVLKGFTLVFPVDLRTNSPYPFSGFDIFGNLLVSDLTCPYKFQVNSSGRSTILQSVSKGKSIIFAICCGNLFLHLYIIFFCR